MCGRWWNPRDTYKPLECLEALSDRTKQFNPLALEVARGNFLYYIGDIAMENIDDVIEKSIKENVNEPSEINLFGFTGTEINDMKETFLTYSNPEPIINRILTKLLRNESLRSLTSLDGKKKKKKKDYWIVKSKYDTLMHLNMTHLGDKSW